MKTFFHTIILLIFFASCSDGFDVNKYYKLSENKKIVHFSIDDCSQIFKNLTEHKYESIFDEYILGKLKKLHDKYGLKVSLYTFYNVGSFCLADVPDYYAEQFKQNADWLKVAPHAKSGDILADSVVRYYDMVKILEHITSTISLTNTARLEKFQGGLEILSAENTPLCLLTADSDNRKSYYLEDSLCRKMEIEEYFHDTINNKFFYKTDFRLDYPDDFANLLAVNATDDCIIFFTHEWLLLETKPRLNICAMVKQYYNTNKIWENLERVCMYVCMYEHEFKTDLDGKYYGK